MVTPSARPRGIIVTLCTGSDLGRSFATTVCPDSWYAVLRFSSSDITIDLRSAPIMILSLASSKSSMSTKRLLARAANSAASLTRLARSAPEKPGVPRAISAGFTSSASGTRRMCTRKICSRPRTSGSGTTTCRSKRPGRSSAGSSTSGRLVAARLLNPARVLQELDDFADFLLGFLDPRDIREGHVHLILAQEACTALAEGHGPAAAGCALHLPQHVQEHQYQKQRRRHLQQQLPDEIRLLGLTRIDDHARLQQRAEERGVVGLGVAGLEGRLVLVHPVDHLALHDHRLDAVA